MKLLMKASVAALAFGIAASSATAQEKLSFYNWFEYIPQELLDKFTEETGIEVTMDTYDSNGAMLASLKSGAIGSYDLAVPGAYMVTIMQREGLLDEIGEGELENHGNIEQQWLDVAFDPGRRFSIPYQWGSTSFSVSRDVFDGDINTTDILFNPPAELVGKINVLDSQDEILAFGSIHLGIPQCSTDRDQLKALNDLLLRAKENWSTFNSDTAKEVLVSGDAAVGMIWNGFAAKARHEGANVEYAYPREGFLAWADNVVLLKDAPNRENAIKFMDFLLEPENMAALTNFTAYSASVKGVTLLLNEELQNSPEANPPADAPTPIFIEVCDEEVQGVYDQIWLNVKK